jgi:hypothetical protein
MAKLKTKYWIEAGDIKTKLPKQHDTGMFRSLDDIIRDVLKCCGIDCCEGIYPGGGGGATNLTYIASATNGTIVSDTGSDATIPQATITDAGLLIPADKIKLNNLSGVNTGDQTSIVGITGTKAQFNTAVTDGDFLYVGDITQYTDELAQDAIGAMIDTSLVYVDGTPLLTRAALIGDITATQGSNSTLIANNVVTNAKLAQASSFTLKGNNTGAVANVTDLSIADVKTLLAYTGADVANTPAGNIAATTVQAAINELDGEKQVNLQFQEEGVNLGTSGTVDTVNFTGAAVTSSRVGNTLTVDIPATIGVTNLSYTPSATNGIVVSDTGTDATITSVTGVNAGLATPTMLANSHVPTTFNDSGTIDFTVSGTDNQTITATLLGVSGATIGQVPQSDGAGNITWVTPTSATNLTYTASPTQGTVLSDTGTDAIIPSVTVTDAGLATPSLLANSHVPVTTTAGTVTITQSGTDNQTLKADITGIDTATIGQIPSTDGAGNVVWVAQTPSQNIYNSDGTLTGNRTVDQNGNSLIINTTYAGSGLETHIEQSNNIAGIGGEGVGFWTENTDGYLSALYASGGIAVNSSQNAANTQFSRTLNMAGIGYQFAGMSVSDGTTQNDFNVNTTDITVSQYPNTRDDSGITTPTNVLYTDASGKFLSAPVSSIVSADNGLYVTGGITKLGGQLIEDTVIVGELDKSITIAIADAALTEINKLQITNAGVNLKSEGAAETSEIILNDGELSLRGETILKVITNGTPTSPNGSVLTLIDNLTGEAEWQPAGGSSVTVTDSNTIDLTVTGSDITGSVKLDTANGGLTATTNGLLFNADGVNTYDNTTSGITATTVQDAIDEVASSFWKLTGNAGTDGGATNFVGTTDAQDLVLKTNGVEIARFKGDGTNSIIMNSSTNTATGYGSMVIGEQNSSTGGYSFTAGIGNVVNGEQSMCLGNFNTCYDDNNVMFGSVNIADGAGNFIQGGGNHAYSWSTTIFGNYCNSYSNNNTIFGDFNTDDSANPTRLFTIANGDNNLALPFPDRNNALTMWKNGKSMWNGDVEKVNTWIGINGTDVQNFINVTTPAGNLAAISTEHTPSGNYVVLGSNNGNSGLVINNTRQFAFTTTAGTTSTQLGATSTVANYSNTGFLFGGGGVATSTVDVNGSFATNILSDNTAALTLTNIHRTIINTGAATTYTLPVASTCRGREYIIANHGTGNITFATPITVAFGVTSTILSNVNGSNNITIQSDGTSWVKVGN